MLRSDKKLFCYFSGYTEPSVRIIHDYTDEPTDTFHIIGENLGKYKLSVGEQIQLNGLLFEVIIKLETFFSASTTQELLRCSSFNPTLMRSNISLGILVGHDDIHQSMWTLQPSASGTAIYKGFTTLTGHQHTLKLDFEAPSQFRSAILEDKHLGLDGSSLTAKEVSTSSNLVKFSIYCGKETREKTKFNEKLAPNTLVSLTEPAAVFKFS